MESVFYRYGFKKRFPVSYLFLELFAKKLENSEPDTEVRDILEPVLSALGHDGPHTEEFLMQVLEDLKEIQDVKSGDAPVKQKGGKRTFGQEFIKWFASLDQAQALIVLTDYDFDKAYKLYSTVPALLVDKMIQTRIGYEWTQAEANFEAVIFGMGGSIKGGGKADKSHEAPKTKEAETARNADLKKLGFM
mgnify:CR=1 FL=1